QKGVVVPHRRGGGLEEEEGLWKIALPNILRSGLLHLLIKGCLKFRFENGE
ncbi:Hypothetical protein FKW44_017442, partial [Caligus rogercresseyi]